MRTMIVDDEPWMLKQFETECRDMADVEIIGLFRSPEKALAFAPDNRVELAFLDIEMPGMNGMALAAALRKIQPEMVVIFVSAYESYMAAAFRTHGADYFIMKPYEKKDVENAVDRARLLSGRLRKSIMARTFGSFDLFLHGKPLAFPDEKTKELMALLVDRRGGLVTADAACRALFPDMTAEHGRIRLRRAWKQLKAALEPGGFVGVAEQNEQGVYLHTDAIDCDLYQYLEGSMKAIRQYAGQYMTGYDWASATRADLDRQDALLAASGPAVGDTALCSYLRFLCDDALTITQMNESFLAVTGYGREEIASVFHNSLRALIVREDAARLDGAGRQAAGHVFDTEFRLHTKSGEAIWVMSRSALTVAPGGGDGLPEVESVLFDISGLKAEQHTLEQQAQRDPLTGLWNRGAAQALIERYIAVHGDTGAGTLLLMDVDRFKAVNDTYGHPFADTVLTDVAAILTRSFRAEDVVCRLGGDEMLVFLKDCGKSEAAGAKIRSAIAAVAKRLTAKTQRGELSCSFGVAYFPDDAVDFATLYQCADLALYCAKEQRGVTVAYSDVRMRTLNALIEREVTEIDPRYQGVDSASLHEKVRAWLLETQDFPRAVHAVLGELGRRYDLSRVYICEFTADGTTAVNTFAWHAAGVGAPADGAAPVYAPRAAYEAAFGSDGLLYCYDVKRLQKAIADPLEQLGVKSLLQCAMQRDGKLFGWMGFDECRKKRYWSGRQVRTLAEFTKTLGEALLAYRDGPAPLPPQAEDTAEQGTNACRRERQ